MELKNKLSTRQLYQKSHLAQQRLNTLLKFLPDPVLALTLEYKVEYVNPAFEKIFGWTLKELKGKNIKFVPDHLIDQTKKGIKKLFENRSIHDFETQRYTKDKRVLDILINGSILYDEDDKPAGQVLILRDMTDENRNAQSNKIMFRISRALHQYKKLGNLIAFVNNEIQKLISIEGSFILLADKSKDQLYFFSAHYKNRESEKKFKKIRFPADQGVSGRVYKTGEPICITDVSQCSYFLRQVDNETDLVTKSILSVPIKLKSDTIGVVSVVNKKHGEFDDTDVELLSMVASTIALPIENTRIHEKLKKSYKELKTLNRAKENVIHHLAHELKTPVSVLSASMKLLFKKFSALGLENQAIEKNFKRGERNLQRILEIQYEVADMLKENDLKAYNMLNRLLDACKDELEVLIENETESNKIINSIQDTIARLFGPRKIQSETLALDEHLTNLIGEMDEKFKHRKCILTTKINKTNPINIPSEILTTVLKGVIRNAIENTPDKSRIEITTKNRDNLVDLTIKDHGTGFTKEKLHLIFENYFSPPESTESPASINYSTKNPYDFNAGGRGFDLLRIKIFSERYNFKITINSKRCKVIPKDTDICPGDVSLCKACTTPEDCLNSGGTSINIRF